MIVEAFIASGIGYLASEAVGSGSVASITTRPPGPIILTGDSVGPIHFHTPKATTVADLEILLENSTPKISSGGGCGVDSVVTWPNFMAYFAKGKFVGYQSANDEYLSLDPKYIDVETQAGMRPFDTIAQAEHIYGAAFITSSAQGGSWSVATKTGHLIGYLKSPPVPTGPNDQIADIGAGAFGCPAASP